MFLFGIKMLWEAWRMKPTEGEDTQREVEEELARRGSTPSLTGQTTDEEAGQDEEMRSMNPIPEETIPVNRGVEEAKEKISSCSDS